MRIWDINPGYLNRQSLLGEHRELHGLVSIMVNNKKGYSKHPETLRWIGYGWAINIRHKQLVSEMELRGYTDKSPVRTRSNKLIWPEKYIDSPYEQFEILKKKYVGKESGRIVLPKSAQELWAQHKYSVMARDYNLYKQIASDMSTINNEQDFSSFVVKLINILRMEPDDKARRNTLQHMWGYVSKYSDLTGNELNNMDQKCLLKKIQDLSKENNEEYLMHSTALSELVVWF
ncbi:MAG: DUF1722 domain-containing protein [Candidatus Delongbacteria bacterium]|jgi:uncharacterized protein YbgA (DUF1722 family)|nr:DUF1722 domain-containing protein [Candidatus Delongbacteria bacterium]